MPDRAALLAPLLALALLAGCGEPDVDLALPDRQGGAYVHDEAGVIGEAVDTRLEALHRETGFDAVALAFEDDRASLGQADRGGRALLERWEADVVLVAVAFPGHFEEPNPDRRRRYFGVTATDRFAVDRGLRERIVEDAVPPPAAANDWTGAFMAAIDVLEDELAQRRD